MFSVHSSINKMWHSHTEEYYSAIKGTKCICHNVDELWKPYTMWKKPDTKGHMLHDPISMKQTESIHKDRKQEWLIRAPEFLSGMKNVLLILTKVMAAQHCECTSPAHWLCNCSLCYITFTSKKFIKVSNTILLLTRPLRGFLLFHPVVVGRVVPVVGKADPRPRDANAGIPVVIITDPSPREVSRPPRFREFAHGAGGHGAVTLWRHVGRISTNQRSHGYKGTGF